LLFVPAHIDRFFARAMVSDADALVFDLEDGVPEGDKISARRSLKIKLRKNAVVKPVFIRINSIKTGLLENDIKTLAIAPVNGFVVPKIRNAGDILYVENMLNGLERSKGIAKGRFLIIPMIETAEAALSVLDIARSSKRIFALIFGCEDFYLDLQATHDKAQNNLQVPKILTAMAARAAGVQPIDSPYLEIKDLKGCADYIKESRKLGFSGMMTLHPDQIKTVNAGFSPSKEEIKKARKILSLNAEAGKKGRSIAYSKGLFIAPPILAQAKQILSLAERRTR
jgi:citrate lyase subunit beta/citryl-CoA lyase